METLVKNYYRLRFPNDVLGNEIVDDLTFEKLWDELDKGNECVYDTIGIVDSIVREGIFAGLAEYKNVNYQVVYDKWLKLNINRDLWDFTNEYKKITKNFPCLPSDFNYSYFGMSDITETIQALSNTLVDAYFGGEEDTVEEVLKLILRLTKLTIKFNKHFGT